ncbi:membrane protein, partial [Candidatus Magnetobacterium bavaricum]
MKGTKNEKSKKKKQIEIDIKNLYLVLIPSFIIAITIVRVGDIANFLAVLFVCLILMSIVMVDIFRY